MPAKKATNITMDELLEQAPPKVLEAGDVIEGKVISASKNEAWLDMGIYGTGYVPRREMNHSRKLEEGEEVSASVVAPEFDEEFALLSLKKVAKEKGWDHLVELFENDETCEVSAYDANRGGLLIEVEGIRGFLPVSQLSAKNYPRVSNADKDEILQKLNSLTDKPLKVRILDLDRNENKLIFSEKEAMKELTQKRLKKLEVGEILEGIVTGVVDFGIFVNVEGVEGLIHISEISWDRVSDPGDYVKVGDKVEAKVIAIDGDKLSLSMKQLHEDPWLEEIKNFKEGIKVKGKVTRITPFGAFIQLTPAIEALVHVSELGKDAENNPEEIFTLGEEREFTIIDIDEESRKISLSLGAKKAAPKKKSTKSAKAETKKKTKSKESKQETEEAAKAQPSTKESSDDSSAEK
ncbi:MAG: S1 RNA-binding domain-containing protein [Candidatus Saccharimonadales bacterium]